MTHWYPQHENARRSCMRFVVLKRIDIYIEHSALLFGLSFFEVRVAGKLVLMILASSISKSG